MYTGALPPATVHGTWSDNIEIWSVDDDVLADLSGVTEIELRLRDPLSRVVDLTLLLSEGEITIPAPGIIQWRAEASQMQALLVQRYDVILLLESEDDTVALVLGSISIVD